MTDTNELKQEPRSGLSDLTVKLGEPWEECRAAFVKIIKEENFYDYRGRQSLRANWSGPKAGFADEMVQRRYNDFTLGWNTARSPNV